MESAIIREKAIKEWKRQISCKRELKKSFCYGLNDFFAY